MPHFIYNVVKRGTLLRLINTMMFANSYGSIICIRLYGYNLSQNLSTVQHPSFRMDPKFISGKGI